MTRVIRPPQDSHADPSDAVLEQKNPADILNHQTKYRTWAFDIPSGVRMSEHDPSIVVLRELGVAELREARRLGDVDGVDRAVVLSLWKVDGRPVDHADEQGTILWSKFSTKVRTLLGVAWSKIHSTTKEEDASFLGSMRPE